MTSPFQGWSPSHFPSPCLPPQNILNISNSNYYPITVTQLTIEVLHLSLVVGQVTNSLLLHIGPLASEQVTPQARPGASPPHRGADTCGDQKGQLGLGFTLCPFG